MKSPVANTETRILVTRKMNCVAFRQSPLPLPTVTNSDNSQRGTGGFESSYEDVAGSFHPNLVLIRSIESERERSTRRAVPGQLESTVVIHKDKDSNRSDMRCEK